MSSKNRNIWLDNVKGFLIICVVIGHFLESGIDYGSDTSKSLFLFIYSFHMPLFIFTGGLLCGHALAEKDILHKKILAFAGLFFMLKLLIYPFQRLNNPDLSFSVAETDGVPWYLFAMCVFYSSAYLMRDIDKRKILAVSLVIALIAGYDNAVGDVLVLSRILVFFPWFVIGWMCDVRRLEVILHPPGFRIGALITILVFLVIFRTNIENLYIFRRFFTGRSSYETVLGDADEVGILFRLLSYMITLVLGVCILALIPQKKFLYLHLLGKNSLQIYFLHRPVLFYLEYTKAYPFLYWHCGALTNYLWLALAVLLVLVLALPVFSVPFRQYLNCINRSFVPKKAARRN